MVGMGCDAKGEVEMFVATQLLNMRSQVVIWIGRGRVKHNMLMKRPLIHPLPTRQITKATIRSGL